jgi:hypothetical protein
MGGHRATPDFAALLKAKKLKIWVPGPAIYQHRGEPGLLLGYLRTVGTYLAEGHFKEARAAALQAKTELGRGQG